MADYNKGERAEAYAALKLVERGLKKEVRKCGNIYTMLKNGKIKIKTPQGIFVSTPAECQTILNDIKEGKKYFFVGKTNKSIKSDCDVSDDGINFVNSSIKSFVGARPTLLNASQSTRVAYCIGKNAIDDATTTAINNTKDIDQKISLVLQTNKITFGRFHNNTFESNLRAINKQLPDTIMNILMKRYLPNSRYNSKELKYLKNLADESEVNALKDLLIHAMIGMMPTRPYKKKDGKVGLLVIVKHDWNIDVVDIKSAKFRNKLFNAAFIETPSTTRHDFAKVYLDPQTGEYFFDLCLQIRLSSALI